MTKAERNMMNKMFEDKVLDELQGIADAMKRATDDKDKFSADSFFEVYKHCEFFAKKILNTDITMRSWTVMKQEDAHNERLMEFLDKLLDDEKYEALPRCEIRGMLDGMKYVLSQD